MQIRALVAAGVQASEHQDILDLAEHTLDKVRSGGISGAMLFWDHGFLYCLEGDQQSVHEACALIRAEPHLRDVEVLTRVGVNRPAAGAAGGSGRPGNGIIALGALRRLVESGAIRRAPAPA